MVLLVMECVYEMCEYVIVFNVDRIDVFLRSYISSEKVVD